MDSRTALKVAATQTVAVAVVSIVLALLLPKTFFESWGWISGPAAWMACAALTARLLSLSIPRTLIGAAVCGLPSLVAVVVGVHWLGAVIAIVLLAPWCGLDPSTTSSRTSAELPSAV